MKRRAAACERDRAGECRRDEELALYRVCTPLAAAAFIFLLQRYALSASLESACCGR